MTIPDDSRSTVSKPRRGGEFAAFFDGLEDLRRRVEDPNARKQKTNVDFSQLREDIARHIAKFDLIRPLLWAFLKGLLGTDEQRLVEMLLTVIVEALPAAADSPERLTAACRFVANGAAECRDAGMPGVANRAVLNALGRFQREVAMRPRGGTGDGVAPPPEALGEGEPRRRAWTVLLTELVVRLPVERDRVLFTYALRVLDRALWEAERGAAAGLTPELWAALLDRALSAVAPGTRSPVIDALAARVARVLGPDGRLRAPLFGPFVAAIARLPRFKAWWSAFLQRQSELPGGGDPLAPDLEALARAALRDPAPGEGPTETERRLLGLASVGAEEDIARLAAVLADNAEAVRARAVTALGRLHGSLHRRGSTAGARVVLERLSGALRDPSSEVVRAAVRALAGCGLPDLVDPLLALYQRTPESQAALRAEILVGVAPLALGRTETLARHRALLQAERARYQRQPRGKMRDRALAALDQLLGG